MTGRHGARAQGARAQGATAQGATAQGATAQGATAHASRAGFIGAALAAALVAFAAACAPVGARADHPAPVGPSDLAWLGRLTYGPDSATLAHWRALGRARFVGEQLTPPPPVLPVAVEREIAALPHLSRPAADTAEYLHGRERQIAALTADGDRQQARRALRQEGLEDAAAAKSVLLWRALYAPDQLNEQLVWFWLNHFSVHEAKGHVAFWLADYQERAIRQHALGRFADLVLAAATHPAMLTYLDNAQNALGHVNENYARELLELHTLGVNGGYTQADVEALARVLTGFGLREAGPARVPPRLVGYYRAEGGFEFNPARHDFTPKVLLGRRIEPAGYEELVVAVNHIVRQKACADFIAGRLATYFVGDAPPPALVARLSRTFSDSGGDIRTVMRALVDSPEFEASLGQKYKDPMHFVVGAVRLAYDGEVVTNVRPLIGLLGSLDQGLYGRQTPDGYPLDGAAYASSGQLAKRVDAARSFGRGDRALFAGAGARAGAGATGPAFAQLSNRLYFEAIEPGLSAQTKGVLARAPSPQEWNALLISAPELNYR
jgi:uncharacterized protein (DUF1800 family)